MWHSSRAGACPIRREVKARYRDEKRKADRLKEAPLEDRVVDAVGRSVHSAMASFDHAPAPRYASASSHRSTSAHSRKKSRSNSRHKRPLQPSPMQQEHPSHDPSPQANPSNPPNPASGVVPGPTNPSALMPPPKTSRAPKKKKGKAKSKADRPASDSEGTDQGQPGPAQGASSQDPSTLSAKEYPSLPQKKQQSMTGIMED